MTKPPMTVAEPREIPLSEMKSPVLDRLIEEVQHDEAGYPNAYNRFHHRHNR